MYEGARNRYKFLLDQIDYHPLIINAAKISGVLLVFPNGFEFNTETWNLFISTHTHALLLINWSRGHQ